MEASDLIAQLHGRVLRAAAVACGTRFQGLQQVARYIRTHRVGGRGPRQAAVVRKLVLLDGAFSLGRHITAVSCESFMVDVLAQLTVQEVPVDGAPGTSGQGPYASTTDATPFATVTFVDAQEDIAHCDQGGAKGPVASLGTHGEEALFSPMDQALLSERLVANYRDPSDHLLVEYPRVVVDEDFLGQPFHQSLSEEARVQGCNHGLKDSALAPLVGFDFLAAASHTEAVSSTCALPLATVPIDVQEVETLPCYRAPGTPGQGPDGTPMNMEAIFHVQGVESVLCVGAPGTSGQGPSASLGTQGVDFSFPMDEDPLPDGVVGTCMDPSDLLLVEHPRVEDEGGLLGLPYVHLSTEEALVRGGNHVLVDYALTPRAGHDFLAAASHIAGEFTLTYGTGSSGPNDAAASDPRRLAAFVFHAEPARHLAKIAYPCLLFERITNGCAMICTFLALSICNIQGMGDVEVAMINGFYFPPYLLRLLTVPPCEVSDMWRILGRATPDGGPRDIVKPSSDFLQAPNVQVNYTHWLGGDLITQGEPMEFLRGLLPGARMGVVLSPREGDGVPGAPVFPAGPDPREVRFAMLAAFMRGRRTRSLFRALHGWRVVRLLESIARSRAP